MNPQVIENQKVHEIINRIKSDGPTSMHVLLDFDKTLTKGTIDGRKTPSLISQLYNGNYLEDGYADKAQALYDKYYPIESDPHIPIEEKKKKMHEWWETHFKLMITAKLNEKDLHDVVHKHLVHVRKGVSEFLQLLNDHNIPVVIISASGVGEFVKMYMKQENLDLPNIHYVTNAFEWDEEGYMKGYKEPIIHSMNKDETVIHDFPEIYTLIKNRKNVLLIGDSLGDPHMIEGFAYDNVIKIGFLIENEEELQEAYTNVYDIVLTGDGDFSPINKIAQEVITNGH